MPVLLGGAALTRKYVEEDCVAGLWLPAASPMRATPSTAST